MAAKKRKRSKKRSAKKMSSAKHRKGKGHVPLPILKKRLAKLSKIVAARS